jgi:HK97 family phage prohead protease
VTEVRSEGGLSVERRFNPASAEFRPELRKVAGSSQPHIQGYGSVFNKLSRNLGGFVEQVDGQAFRNSMAQGWPDVVCRYNHNDDWLLGTTKAGTCVLTVDGTGLHYDVEVPDTRAGNDVATLTRRGDVTSSSFAFRVPDGGDFWERSNQVGGLPLRTLLDLELVDVAPVNTPAYPDATAFVRSAYGAIESLARQFDADPAEVRQMMEQGKLVSFFKRSDRPSNTAHNTEVSEMANDEGRAKISTASKNDLPDSAFAYIEPGGTKDESGKTTPRSKRHFPIHDAAHVRNALARIGQGAQFGQQALPKVKAAAKKFGIDSSTDSKREFDDVELVIRAIAETHELLGLDFDEDRAKGDLPPWLQKKQGDAQGSQDSDSDDDDSDDASDDDDKDDKAPVKAPAKVPAKRDSSKNEDQETPEGKPGTVPSADDDEDDDEDDEVPQKRSAPGQPETKEDAEEDDKEKAEAEAEMKQKAKEADEAEAKRRWLKLMEKRHDPFLFDGE